MFILVRLLGRDAQFQLSGWHMLSLDRHGTLVVRQAYSFTNVARPREPPIQRQFHGKGMIKHPFHKSTLFHYQGQDLSVTHRHCYCTNLNPRSPRATSLPPSSPLSPTYYRNLRGERSTVTPCPAAGGPSQTSL